MIVDISELSVSYDGIYALEKISFGINEGDFLGIIGPNGAGKSTLFRCMLGIHLEYQGAIKFFNKDIRKSDEYGLTQHTITKGVHDHSQPTAKSIEDIIDLAKELDLSVIFAEDTSDIRISQVIADEIGADVLILSPVATEDIENKNYFERMQQNASNLKKALCN